jgi:iron(III) transport system ATP-binding protein
MARVDLRKISKNYPGLKALHDVTLSVRSGEFFTLLGPSGCGKTTLLRTVAGFNRQDGGEVLVDGRRIDDLPAHRRNIGMVYQDYAIFPHLSVAGNVAFGLEMRGRPPAEIAERTARALDLVQLRGLAARRPHELSGGQQQRVALARAVVINPQILLMDEPLSNLDAKLRVELRDEIRDLQRSLGITTIYVTHDQEEALGISDRICVMRSGRVHQVGTPQDIYAQPATLFVASFVGGMNVIPDVAVGPGGEVVFGAGAQRLMGLAGRSRATLTIRPEDVVVAAPAPDGPAIALEGIVTKVTFAGREAYYRVDGGGGLALRAHVYRPHERPLAVVGERVQLALPLGRLHAFADDEKRIELRT